CGANSGTIHSCQWASTHCGEGTKEKGKQMTKYSEEWTREELRKLQNQLDELRVELQKHQHEENRLRRELEEQNKTRARFIATLANELRTPLTPVLASAQLLIEQFHSEPGSAQDRLIRSIIHGAESLESRLSNLLELGKFQAAAFILEIAPISITSLLNDSALQFEPLAKSKRQTLTLELQEMPLLKADRRRVGQVVTNLLGNAIKFTPEGGRIVLKAMTRDQDLVVEVQDSGTGLRPEEQRRLFQPYYRSDVDRQRLSGTGLGLSLSKEIVEAHNGKIWVNSEPGKGSTFGFSIPLRGAPAKVRSEA
ncbi:HAMP domain-containing histidine kinase, partial [Patescibacteria group bacterium]|nr:HAMP domain-containing histidine kinase [Patescibacteria group bacterium]